MYESEPIDPYGGQFTVRPVYDFEADEYIDHLCGQAEQEPPSPRPVQFVSPSDEQQPTSLREELEAMGWFTDM
jgi:hypothetical protein